VLACAEAVALEQRLLARDPAREWEAMQRAGCSLGEAILRDFHEIGPLPAVPRLFILAGKGHNAGDAFIAATSMLEEVPEMRVRVCFTAGPKQLSPLAHRAWEDLRRAGEAAAAVDCFSLEGEGDPCEQLRRHASRRFTVFIDGLFGMNFRPPFRPPMDRVVQWANDELEADLRAAVDLPSGLGDHPADLAVRADFSYMTGSAKAPLFDPDNAAFAGRLRYLDLGFFDEPAAADSSRVVLTENILRPLRGLRSPLHHKRKHGHLLVVGGSRKMPGAVLMSIMAAARSGCGLLTAAVPESLVTSFAPVVPEAMWIGLPETPDGGIALEGMHLLKNFLSKATAVLMGPGVGTEKETQALLSDVARCVDAPLVLDAEALQKQVVEKLAERENMRGRFILTPHTGEYSRISDNDFSETGEDGLREFAGSTGALTLLKGPPFTRVCDGRKIACALAGGPVLARGGSGDILAGITGSMVAQEPDDLFLATCRAALWHGLAAEALARSCGHEAVRTTQLLDFLSPVLRRGLES